MSDSCTPQPVRESTTSHQEYRDYWEAARRIDGPGGAHGTAAVYGGYLERLPLAAVRAGLGDSAEVWSFAGDDGARERGEAGGSGPVRRRFRAESEAPYRSTEALAHVDAWGVPEVLCVWGLGVEAALLSRCAESVRVYNSIDAPALRVPDDVSRHIDVFLTSADWQSAEVLRRHPGAIVEVMPIGPEFASPETFFPTGAAKDFDVIYVAAAQDYKRHDILFDAFARLPPEIRGLCVFGYGENAERYRAEIERRGLNIVCVGPPGVGYAEVNALMNRARIGVVCGEADGAPAVLTEYMLAGLPVLANEALCCGLQFITPETGLAVPAARLDAGILALLERAPAMKTRDVVLEHWVWERTIARFSDIVERARQLKR